MMQDRLVQLSLLLQYRAEIVVGVGGLGIEFNRLLEVKDGFFQASLLHERIAQVGESARKSRGELQSIAVFVNRFVHPSQLKQRDAEIIVGVGECRPPCNGNEKIIHCRSDIAILEQGFAQIVERCKVSGPLHAGIFPNGNVGSVVLVPLHRHSGQNQDDHHRQNLREHARRRIHRWPPCRRLRNQTTPQKKGAHHRKGDWGGQ